MTYILKGDHGYYVTYTSNKTFAISGPMLQEILHDNRRKEMFKEHVNDCKNFVLAFAF